MQEVSFFDFKIANLKSLEEAKEIDLGRFDLVNVCSHLDFGFWRPQKIIWRLKLDNPDPFSYILSKKERKKIRKLLKKADFKVEIKIPLEQDLFLKWLEIYKKVIGQKKRGVVKIDGSWLAEKKEKKQLTGGIFVFKNDKLKGASLFVEPEDEKRCFSFAYSAYGTEGGDYHSYRSLVEYYFIRKGIEEGCKFLGHGKDTNLYGMHLSTGLFEFKSRYGYKPNPYKDKETPFVTTFFINREKFFKEALFVYFKNRKPRLALLTDKPKEKIFLQRFTHAGLPIDIFEFLETCRKVKENLRDDL